MAAGAPKKYKSAKSLREAVDRYFASISRIVTLTERVPVMDGDRVATDEKGHTVYENREIINQLGEPVRVIEFAVPPTTQGLADYLGIHRSTWDNYCDPEKHPEFFDTTTRARGRLRAYLETESLSRSGKDLKGVLFNLQNNYGLRERKEIELGPTAARALASSALSPEEREELLRSLTDEAEDDQPGTDSGGD